MACFPNYSFIQEMCEKRNMQWKPVLLLTRDKKKQKDSICCLEVRQIATLQMLRIGAYSSMSTLPPIRLRQD